MLVAQRSNGQTISLLDGWTRQKLKRLKEEETFVCPGCQKEVILKLGTKKLPHFAHKRETKCPFEHETESSYHASGKRDLFTWLQKQAPDVQLEPYFLTIQQRPDLYVNIQGRPYVFEYQCSVISEAQFQKRNNGYKKTGMQPIWILGAHQLQRLSAFHFKLSRFQWLFTQYVSSISPQPLLFYYCPQTEKLIRLVHLVPFSTYHAFSVPIIQKIDHVRIHDFFTYPQISLPSSFWRTWLMQKTKWRQTFTFYPSTLTRAVCADFYLHHPPSLFPCEAGWPLQFGYLFESPPFIWQTYILLFINSSNRTYSLAEIYNWIKKKIAERKLFVRALPLAQAYPYTRAIYEYIQRLEQLGYVRWMTKKSIQRIQNWTFPATIEEALANDRSLLEQIKRTSLSYNDWREF
ncbi:competence protein CoiA [Anoxybacteroides rupiense]|uniref:competence protein CoiA n=1 Tax=Anoxybacteroides rupiense TaxID=311460 RepID=UPI001F098F45|nr:competence protein CoiA family protein [Anoxybacillus rupiensis]